MAVHWSIAVRWGDRRVATEVLGPRAPRTELSLGNGPTDDVPTGYPSHIGLKLEGEALEVTFSAEVDGAVQRRGAFAVPLRTLVQAGQAREADGRWTVRLAAGDSARFQVGTLRIEVERARVGPNRLPVDATPLGLFLLALAGVLIVLASVLIPRLLGR